MVAITTLEGTHLLVRAEKHLPGLPDVASPYLEMPPTVSSAYVRTMHERREWLWPVASETIGGVETFTLTPGVQGEGPTSIVHYDTRNSSAQRDEFHYRLPEGELGRVELEGYAGMAR